MLTKTPLVAELELDIARCKAGIPGAPNAEQLRKEFFDLEGDRELRREEVASLLAQLDAKQSLAEVA